MHLPDMSKRLVPFPLVLVAITGTFILIALYADVRGRERRAAETPAAPAVGVDNYQPLPDETASSTPVEGAENAPLQHISEPLGLPPETPTSDIPAVAVFDCWRYEWRGDRLIVDHDYRHIAGDGIVPAVGPETVHLRCKDPQYAQRTPDGSVTIYWSGRRAETDRPQTVVTDTLYRIDPQTGELTEIAKLDGLNELTDYALLDIGTDQTAVWLRADSSKNGVSTLYHITLDGDVRSYSYPQIGSPLELTPDQSRAVGFEYTRHGDLFVSPVYLHRINLATGARVRTKPIASVLTQPIPETNWRPAFIDDEHLIMPGAADVAGGAQGAAVVNVMTGTTARVSQLTGTVELFALTQDGSTFYTLSDSMPLTAIPVSELPKP